MSKLTAHTKKITCYHCGDTCKNNEFTVEEKVFCCNGCKTVYSVLAKNNLCTYYDLNEQPGTTQNNSIRTNKYQFLDDDTIQQKLLQFTDGKTSHISFYLPQIHCSSCLWLLESLSTLHAGIISARVNFTKKQLWVAFSNTNTSLRKIVEMLTAIGYEPHISLQDGIDNSVKKIDRSRWYKIGVAGFCFSNIMMLSLPEYFSGQGGVQSNIATMLRSIIVVLSLPVFFYSAAEFFSAAWKGLRNGYLNIDAPVALALIITFLRSLYEIFSDTGVGYLDSMTGIVFFMLIGRWLQDKTQQSISFDRDYASFFPIAVNVIRNGEVSPCAIEKIKEDDIIQVHNNEIIPVDCMLSKGKAQIDYSFVNGESLPVAIQPGEIIYAGGKQLGGILELIVVKRVAQSYLTNLWNKDRANIKEVATPTIFDAIAKYFTYVVLAIGLIAAIYWYNAQQSILMWNAITTVLIVACPCALLLSANYTNGNIMRILGLNKFYLKSPDVIDHMVGLNYIVFDKTGTLTKSKEAKIIYTGILLSSEEKDGLAQLLKQSAHPVAKAVYDYLKLNTDIYLTNFRETTGAGIEGWVNERHIKAGSAHFIQTNKTVKGTALYVSIDGKFIGSFKIANQYRWGIFELIQQLKNKFSIAILSGDNDAELPVLRDEIGANNIFLFNQQPHEKAAFIQELQRNKQAKVMMVGDGLNDAIALQQSNVGVAVADNSNTFTPASDAIIDANAITKLNQFIAFAKKGRTIIISCFIISAVYNIIGLWFAVQGKLSPVIAAILMPISSVTIILLTYGITQWVALRSQLKIQNQ